MKPRNKILLGWIALMPVIHSGCSANAAKDTPCERKCGSRPITGGKLRAIPLTNEVTIQCTPGTTAQALQQLEYSFLIFDDRSVASSTSTNTSGTTTAQTGSTLGDSSKTPDRIPMAGVAFYPAVVGVTASAAGTDTASSDWCTDSCGIATLKVTPLCAKQDMQVGIIVPGLTGEAGAFTSNPNPSVKVSITFP